MCIRDRWNGAENRRLDFIHQHFIVVLDQPDLRRSLDGDVLAQLQVCLLYTSKVTRFVDLNNQISQNGFAVFSDIIRIGLHNVFSVVVPAGQGGDFPIPVIFNLDFRIDAQSQGCLLYTSIYRSNDGV